MHLIGDQEVTSSIPAGSGKILLWRLIMKYFLLSFSSTDSRRAVVSFWPEDVHKYWLTASRTKLAQEKV